MATYKAKGVRDVSAEDFIEAYSAHLKSNDRIQLPSWVDIVKTSTLKELAPYDPDWYYVRAASVARKIYLREGLGIATMSKIYGGRDNRRGSKPEHYRKAARGLIRHICQQLENIGLLEKCTEGKGGRKLTSAGQRDMDIIAGRITAQLPIF